jgi:hypothetical protein
MHANRITVLSLMGFFSDLLWFGVARYDLALGTTEIEVMAFAHEARRIYTLHLRCFHGLRFADGRLHMITIR